MSLAHLCAQIAGGNWSIETNPQVQTESSTAWAPDAHSQPVWEVKLNRNELCHLKVQLKQNFGSPEP